MRGLLDVLTVFDWITPAFGLAKDLLTDPLQSRHTTLFMDNGGLDAAGVNPKEVFNLLKRNGYKPSNLQLAMTPTGMKFHITIPVEWEGGARELLALNGISLLY